MPWDGVRNFQARNFMRDEMQVGDGVLFYHSSCPEPGIAGLAEVVERRVSRRDAVRSEEPLLRSEVASASEPRWYNVDVKLVRKTRAAARSQRCASAPELATMRVLQRGNRLSITPVTPEEWRAVLSLLELDDLGLERLLVVELLALGTFAGFLAGLLGIGGGMLMVPFLT